MPKFTERTDAKCHLTGDSVPERVQSLSHATNCPIINPDYLFFKRGAAQYLSRVTSKQYYPESAEGWCEVLDHDVYYLEQMDGSLAVYAYLSIGCLYLGCVHSESWTASPKEK